MWDFVRQLASQSLVEARQARRKLQSSDHVQVIVGSPWYRPERLWLFGGREESLAELIADHFIAVAMDNQHGNPHLLDTTLVVKSPNEGRPKYGQNTTGQSLCGSERASSTRPPLGRFIASQVATAVPSDSPLNHNPARKALFGHEVVSSLCVTIEPVFSRSAAALAVSAIVEQKHG